MAASRLPRSVWDSELQVHAAEILTLLYARTSLIVYSVCTNVRTHAEECRALGFLVFETGSLLGLSLLR